MEINLIVFLFLLTVIRINCYNVSDYCNIPCQTFTGTDEHIVCERSNVNCGPHKRCKNFKVIPMTDSDRQAILKKHNELRNRVALGYEKIGQQPPASNMNYLNYDLELEFIAQCLANTCIMQHDRCRRTRSLSVGQNLAIHKRSWSTGLENINLTLSLVQSWYDEVRLMDSREVDSFTGQFGVGHYTEMIWANIEYIGCARAKFTEGGWYSMLLVCNYGGRETSGNILSYRIYEIGQPCSKCPHDRACDPVYKGLCSLRSTQSKSTDPDKIKIGDPATYIKYKVVNESDRVGKENIQKLLFSLSVWMLLSKVFV